MQRWLLFMQHSMYNDRFDFFYNQDEREAFQAQSHIYKFCLNLMVRNPSKKVNIKDP